MHLLQAVGAPTLAQVRVRKLEAQVASCILGGLDGRFDTTAVWPVLPLVF